MPENLSISERAELELPSTLKALIEAMIFAAQEPLSIAQIKAIYQDGRRGGEAQDLDQELIKQVVTDLNKEYGASDRPYRIIQIAGGYQFATLADYATWIGKLYKEQGRRKLSQSGVETLCIIAYKQPITKSEIEKIRGVNCDYVLKTLLEKELVTVTGRAETVGRPLLYGTTKEFLKHFGLHEIVDLPRPREIEEILGESQFETERRMLEAQAGAEQMKKEQEDFKSRLPHIPKKKPDLEQQGVEIVSRDAPSDIKVIVQDRVEETVEQGPGILPKESEAPQGTDDSAISNEKRLESGEPTIVPDERNVEKTDRSEETVGAGGETAEVGAETPSPTFDSPPANDSIKSVEADVPDKGGTHVQSRWKVWREKIRGFIKTLFG